MSIQDIEKVDKLDALSIQKQKGLEPFIMSWKGGQVDIYC